MPKLVFAQTSKAPRTFCETCSPIQYLFLLQLKTFTARTLTIMLKCLRIAALNSAARQLWNGRNWSPKDTLSITRRREIFAHASFDFQLCMPGPRTVMKMVLLLITSNQ